MNVQSPSRQNRQPPPQKGGSQLPPQNAAGVRGAKQASPPRPSANIQNKRPQAERSQAMQLRRPLTPEEQALRRAQIARRKAEIARREAQRRARRNRTVAAIVMGTAILILLAVCIHACVQNNTAPAGSVDFSADSTTPEETTPSESTSETVSTAPPTKPRAPYVPRPTRAPEIHSLTTEIDSKYAVLISLTDGVILAEKAANTRMHPASMTKVMSLIVAYEHINDLNDTFTVTSTIIDPVYTAGASLAGFSPGETVTIADLLYGMILPSGAEASVALAEYVAGSEDAFVDLMNEKASSMGLNDTHFENCTGLTGTNHYSTAVEMSMILAYAMQYAKCAEILSTYQYTTTPTEKHPDGVTLTSTMFSRMYGDEPAGVTVIAGKTGYTDRAHHCLMSYATDDATGEAYIFVSANSTEKFGPVFDAIEVYSTYAKHEDVQADAEMYLP